MYGWVLGHVGVDVSLCKGIRFEGPVELEEVVS